MTLEEQISIELIMYLGYCRMAALHDQFEGYHKMMAHKLFYHIQELRSTRKLSVFGKVSA